MKNVRRNFLNLPNEFEAKNIPKGSEIPSGIIKRIRNEVTDIKSYVYPSYGGTLSGDIDSLVKWNYGATVYSSGAYLQVEFKHGYVYPTSYSIKGKEGYYYAKEWILFGFNTPEEEMTIIDENKSEGTTFCKINDPEYCLSDSWGTFSVKPVKKAFKYFRMIPKSWSCGDTTLLLGGIEFFGLYSIDGKILINGKLKRNTCFQKKYSNLPFYFVFMLIVYSR